MTPHWSASSRMVTNQLTDRRLRSWLSGAAWNNLELNTLKTVEKIVDFSLNPLLSPTYHHELHCDCSGVIQVLGPTISQDLKWDNQIDSIVKKAQQRRILPSPAEEVQPATGTADTVLLCHHWISSLHINNCLVQLSYQIWPQKTTEGSPNCWANHWYNPPHSPGTLLIQSEQKG